MDQGVYLMFKVNTRDLVKNNLYICKDYHIQPSEIRKLPYYEYEFILIEIKVIEEKQQEEQEKYNEKFDTKSMNSQMNNMSRNMMGGGNFKMPNVSMPNINMPKIG